MGPQAAMLWVQSRPPQNTAEAVVAQPETTLDNIFDQNASKCQYPLQITQLPSYFASCFQQENATLPSLGWE